MYVVQEPAFLFRDRVRNIPTYLPSVRERSLEEDPLTLYSCHTDMGGLRTRQEVRPQFGRIICAFHKLRVVWIFIHFGQYSQ